MSFQLDKPIVPLTSLRLFAAGLVIAAHSKGHFAIVDNLTERIAYAQAITFFFVLSGFILTLHYSSFPSFKKIIEYLVRRLSRLWPLHMSVFAMRFFMFPKALITFPGAAPKILVLLSNVFMLHAWIPFFQFFFSYNATSWTISTELFFYLCLPVLVSLITRSVWLPLAITFGVTLACITLCNVLGLDELNQQGLSLRGILCINPLPRVFEFTVGMATAVLFRDHVSNWKINKFWQSAMELGAVALALATMWYTKPIAESLVNFAWIGKAGAYWFESAGSGLLAFSLLVILLARQGGIVSWILSAPLLVFLGDLSYSVYLCHHPLLIYHGLYLSQYRSLGAFVLFLTVMLLMSHLLSVLVETPVRHAVTKVSKEILYGGETKPESAKPSLLAYWKRILAPFKQIIPPGGITKRKLLVSSEVMLLAGLIFLSHPAPNKLTAAETEKFLASGNCLDREVAVGDSITCLGIVPNRTVHDPSVSIAWRVNRPEDLEQYVTIQFLNELGNEQYQQIMHRAPRTGTFAKGDVFVETIEMPADDFARADKIAVSIALPSQEVVSLSSDHTDKSGKRLVLDLNSQISKKQDSRIHL